MIGILTGTCLMAGWAEAVVDVKGEGFLFHYSSRLVKKSDDALAIAIAICHAHRVNAQGVLYRDLA